MTATDLVDSYLLPMPTASTPVIGARWVSATNKHPQSLFGEASWSLAPMIDNPGTSRVGIHWRNCPGPFHPQLRLAAWTLINGELRPTLLQQRGTRARSRISAPQIKTAVGEWMRLARWLDRQGITDLADCTDAVWRDYVPTRWTLGMTRGRCLTILGSLTKLWDFDQLSAQPCGITRPPWDRDGV